MFSGQLFAILAMFSSSFQKKILCDGPSGVVAVVPGLEGCAGPGPGHQGAAQQPPPADGSVQEGEGNICHHVDGGKMTQGGEGAGMELVSQDSKCPDGRRMDAGV